MSCLCLDWVSGCGGNVRLCCRPWNTSARVLDDLEVSWFRLIIQASLVAAAIIEAWTWQSWLLVPACIMSCASAGRDLVYLARARPEAGSNILMWSDSVCAWVLSIFLRLAGSVILIGWYGWIKPPFTRRALSTSPAEIACYWAGGGLILFGFLLMIYIHGRVLGQVRMAVGKDKGVPDGEVSPLLGSTLAPSSFPASSDV
jgi:hypothetical protein